MNEQSETGTGELSARAKNIEKLPENVADKATALGDAAAAIQVLPRIQQISVLSALLELFDVRDAFTTNFLRFSNPV